MLLYKNTKAIVHSSDGDTDFFNIVAWRYACVICVYDIIYQDYVLQMSLDWIKENGFTLKKAKSKGYRAEPMIDADYAYDLMLLTNTPAQAETLLHSLKQAAGGIGLYVNANKTEFICFKQEAAISTKWQVSKISRPVHIPRQQYLIYWKWCQDTPSDGVDCNWHRSWESDLSGKTKQDFFPSCGCVNSTVWMHYLDDKKIHGKKARWELRKNATCCLEQILETAPL